MKIPADSEPKIAELRAEVANGNEFQQRAWTKGGNPRYEEGDLPINSGSRPICHPAHVEMIDLEQPEQALHTVRDWLRYAVSRFNAAGLTYGHGTAKRF